MAEDETESDEPATQSGDTAMVLATGLVTFFVAGLSLSLLIALVHAVGAPKIVAAIIGGTATIVAGIVGAALSYRLEKRKEIELHVREKKIEAYESFLEMYFELTKRASRDEDFSEEEIQEEFEDEYFFDITRELLVWGSDEFIQLWNGFKNSGNLSDEEPLDAIQRGSILLTQIRDEVGPDGSNSTWIDLASLFTRGLHEKLLDRIESVEEPEELVELLGISEEDAADLVEEGPQALD